MSENAPKLPGDIMVDISEFVKGIESAPDISVDFEIPPPTFSPFAFQIVMEPLAEGNLPDLDPIARAFWVALFKKPWPEGWHAFWSARMDPSLLGAVTQKRKRLYLNYNAHVQAGQFDRLLKMLGYRVCGTPDSLNTLIHELMHVDGWQHKNRFADWIYERRVDYLVWKAWRMMR